MLLAEEAMALEKELAASDRAPRSGAWVAGVSADRGNDGAPRVPAAVSVSPLAAREVPVHVAPGRQHRRGVLGAGRAGVAEQVHRVVARRGSRRGRAAGIARGAAGRAVVFHLDAPRCLPPAQLEWDPKNGGLDEHREELGHTVSELALLLEGSELVGRMPLSPAPFVGP
jgi:hypothetical protein